MAIQHLIESLDDPRLAPFRHLKETNATRWSHRFVAEGEKLAVRLLASRVPVESLLVGQRHADRFCQIGGPAVAVYVVPDAWIEQIVGFDFHRGVLACGVRPAIQRLSELPRRPGRRPWSSARTCKIRKTWERSAFERRLRRRRGAAWARLSESFFRRVLRVSMGAGFALPIVEAGDLEAELAAWPPLGMSALGNGAGRHGRTAIKPGASARLALMLGSEGHGSGVTLDSPLRSTGDHPDAAGTDSLNVAVATGYLLVSTRARWTI